MSRDEIFNEVRDALEELTEIDGASIKGDTTLFEELDLDSIDAVDLVVKLQNLTGKKIEPEEFKRIRTVNDVVGSVEELLKAE
jgi:acyl carrier protein